MDEQTRARVDYVRLLRRIVLNRWRTILVGFAAVALPTVGWVVFFAPKMYEASATLFLVSSKAEPAFLRELMSPEENALHLALLKSRSLAEAVADSLPRESREELLSQAVFRDYLLSITNALRRLRVQPVVVYSPQELVVRELQHARMRFGVGKDGTVTIAALAFSPRVAMGLANTYVEVLLSRSGSYAREQARAARELIENLIGQARTNLLDADEALRKFQAQAGGAFKIPEQTHLQLSKLSELENARAEVQASREIAQAKLSFLRGETPKPGQAPVAGMDPAAQVLRERLASLQEKFLTLASKFADQHPLVVATHTEIQDVQERLRAALQGQQTPRPGGALALAPAERAALSKQMGSLQVEILSLQAKEETLKHGISRLKQSLAALGTRELQYTTLVQGVETNRNLMSTLSEKLTAARINEQGQIRTIRIIDQATLPRVPSSAAWRKVLLAGLAAALAFGAGLAGLQNYAYEVIEVEEDVVRATGLPVLGSIPLLEQTKKNGRSEPLNLVSEFGPTSLPAEACRTVRSALEARQPGQALKTILVTSPGSREGKTTVALNLGWTFWETSRSVLLIDADLRRPSLHRALGIPNEPGLADMLKGDMPWPEGCRSLDGGLDVIPAGIQPENPGGLLSSARARTFLASARERADVVVLDSPPVLAVPDNLSLASQVDGTVLVVRSGHTQRRSLVRTKNQLDRVRARVLGVVINELSPRDTRRYYAEYSHYVGSRKPGKTKRKEQGR